MAARRLSHGVVGVWMRVRLEMSAGNLLTLIRFQTPVGEDHPEAAHCLARSGASGEADQRVSEAD